MKKRKIITFVSFVILFVLVGSILTPIFRRKGDLTKWNNFYALEDNSLDILIMGSSLNASAIDPFHLEKETGCSVFNFSIAGQRFPVQNVILKGVLETQKPQLVVMEAYRYIGEAAIDMDSTMYAISGMRNSIDKVRMVKDLPIVGEKNNFIEISIPLLGYHSNWNNLKKQDFVSLKGDTSYEVKGSNGGQAHYGVEPQLELKESTNEIGTLSDAQKKYTKEFLEICEKENIKVLFFNSPNPEYKEGEINQLNALYDFVTENGGYYLDCNYESEIREKIEPKIDFADYHHTNVMGAYKTTHYLADYINKNFQIESSGISNELQEAYYEEKIDNIRGAEEFNYYIMNLFDCELECYIEKNNEIEEHLLPEQCQILESDYFKEMTLETQKIFGQEIESSLKILVINKVDKSVIDRLYIDNEGNMVHF